MRNRALVGLTSLASGLALSLVALPSHAILGPLAGQPAVQYGDALSYSLPVMQLIDGCASPGCQYYVASGVGQIQDLIVLGTGVNGGPSTTNISGMDGAYQTPNPAGGNFFSTAANPLVDPLPNPVAPTWDRTTSWDSNLTDLRNALSGDDPIFFFNNNNVNNLGTSGQSLAAWARVWISTHTAPDTPIDINGVNANFLFANRTGIGFQFFGPDGKEYPYASVIDGGGGTPTIPPFPLPPPLNADVTKFTSTKTDPVVNADGTSDYVLAGGQLCAGPAALGYQLQACDGTQAHTLNHNLGANEVAYAILFPELNAALNWLFSAANTGLGAIDVTTLAFHMDFRLGCDSAFGGEDDPICKGVDNSKNSNPSIPGKNLNNGFEQLFIGTTRSVVNVPEPGTLALLGGTLGLLGFMRRRSRGSRPVADR